LRWALLVPLVEPYPSSLGCSRSIVDTSAAGRIMGTSVSRSGSTAVQLAKNSMAIVCGGTLTPDDASLTLQKGGTGGQYSESNVSVQFCARAVCTCVPTQATNKLGPWTLSAHCVYTWSAVIEVIASVGTGSWGIVSGTRSMTRSTNSASLTYTVPDSGTVTLRVASASGRGYQCALLLQLDNDCVHW